MSDNSKLEITRRRALGGIAAIGAVGASVGAGTTAYFSDEVESQNNTIRTGNIDLRTNGNNDPTTTVSVGGVAPGESGTQRLTLTNAGTIDGYVSLVFGTPDGRNNLTEVLRTTVSVDGTVVRDGTFDSVFDGEGEWSNADVPLPAGNSKTLAIDWSLPGAAGNDVQNREAVGDVAIQLNQQQEAFADLVVGSGGDVTTIQEAVSDTPAGGVILVRDGTYDEAVTVDKANLTIASKHGPSSAELVADASDPTQSNKALLVDGVDGVTIDGLRVSLAAPQPDNSEKYGIRGRPDGSGSGPDDLTVRNCVVENITAEDVSTNGGAVRATGVVVDLEPTGGLGPATVSGVTVENNVLRDIKCVGDIDQSDSRAKGIAVNGNADELTLVGNAVRNIGATTNDDPGVAEDVASTSAEGTGKPRGIGLTEDGNGDGSTNFTILDNLVQGVAGTYGQPAMFVGGSNGLGSDHEVYANEFHHPVDNLSAGVLELRGNTWVNDADGDGIPELVAPDQDNDGGNLVDRNGGSSYDTPYTI